MDPMQQPQRPDPQVLPVQPVVSGSANQTNARTGMVAPNFSGVAASNPGWAERLALSQKLNPPPGTPAPTVQSPITTFSRVLPSNGAPTPTFAPDPVHDAKAGLAALLGITPEHSAQGQTLVAAGAPVTPNPQAPAGPARYDTGPATVQEGQQRLASYPNWQDQPQAQPQVHPATGLPVSHPIHNPEAMSREDFIAANRGVPARLIMQAWQARKQPTMQDQAKSVGAQMQPNANAFADYINKLAMASQYGINQSMGPSGIGAVDPNAVQ